MDWFYQSSAFVPDSSRQLGAELHGFLCDGLELVVSSAVHVEVILKTEEIQNQ